MTLQLPPLRDRLEDILPLLQFFVEEYAHKYSRTVPSISESTQQALTYYDWKGNIREMQNRVERALILTEEDELNLHDFGISPTMINDTSTEENTLQDMERISILKALEKYDGNISQTAEELGLSRAALYRRLEKYNIKN